MPYMAPATAIPKKIKRGSNRDIALNLDLDFDIHDLLHDAVTDQLQGYGRAQHDLAYVVSEENLDVLGIGIEHQHGDRHRNQAERGSGHFSMGADRSDSSAQLEALADHIGQLVQNFRQIAAGALLQEHGRDKEVHVERRHA